MFPEIEGKKHKCTITIFVMYDESPELAELVIFLGL